MFSRKSLTLFVTVAGLFLVLSAIAGVTAQAETSIHVSQLVTDQERQNLRARMRSAKTAEERARIQAEHEKRMKQRARKRAVTPPAASPIPGVRPRAPGQERRRHRGR